MFRYVITQYLWLKIDLSFWGKGRFHDSMKIKLLYHTLEVRYFRILIRGSFAVIYVFQKYHNQII